MEKNLDQILPAAAAMSSVSPPGPVPPTSMRPSSSEALHCPQTPAFLPNRPSSTSIAMTPPDALPMPALTPVPRQQPPPETASLFWDSINETLSGIGSIDGVLQAISAVHMDHLIESYRSMMDFFPFVVLPPTWASNDIIRLRPMVAFAIFTAASYDSALLQLALSREFS